MFRGNSAELCCRVCRISIAETSTREIHRVATPTACYAYEPYACLAFTSGAFVLPVSISTFCLCHLEQILLHDSKDSIAPNVALSSRLLS